MHGYGTINWDQGAQQRGLFQYGLQEGYGYKKDVNQSIYNGMHKAGMREGLGILETSNGRLYEGQFHKNMCHGRGVESGKVRGCTEVGESLKVL